MLYQYNMMQSSDLMHKQRYICDTSVIQCQWFQDTHIIQCGPTQGDCSSVRIRNRWELWCIILLSLLPLKQQSLWINIMNNNWNSGMIGNMLLPSLEVRNIGILHLILRRLVWNSPTFSKVPPRYFVSCNIKVQTRHIKNVVADVDVEIFRRN